MCLFFLHCNLLCYHAYKINSDWVIILTYLAVALLDWRVPFKEEWITKKDGILHKGNLTCFRDRNLNTYLVMQKKCGDWYPKCNQYIFGKKPGDLSEKAIKILNDSKSDGLYLKERFYKNDAV